MAVPPLPRGVLPQLCVVHDVGRVLSVWPHGCPGRNERAFHGRRRGGGRGGGGAWGGSAGAAREARGGEQDEDVPRPDGFGNHPACDLYAALPGLLANALPDLPARLPSVHHTDTQPSAGREPGGRLLPVCGRQGHVRVLHFPEANVPAGPVHLQNHHLDSGHGAVRDDRADYDPRGGHHPHGGGLSGPSSRHGEHAPQHGL
mmetsp:Transcript_35983/g.101306  ORF Transcript_35983/g.101306 Transcript_35983/m.101306 type:complete len:202 (-) Transcript_35983:343-948(-)